jgi:hypothetical protein
MTCRTCEEVHRIVNAAWTILTAKVHHERAEHQRTLERGRNAQSERSVAAQAAVRSDADSTRQSSP